MPAAMGRPPAELLVAALLAGCKNDLLELLQLGGQGRFCILSGWSSSPHHLLMRHHLVDFSALGDQQRNFHLYR